MKEQIQWKLMTKFVFKLKKTVFGLFSSIFAAKETFSKIPGSVVHKFITVSSTIPTLKKLMIQFQEKTQTDGRIDRRTEWEKDGEILFYMTLPTTARDPTNATALDQRSKVKDTE